MKFTKLFLLLIAGLQCFSIADNANAGHGPLSSPDIGANFLGLYRRGMGPAMNNRTAVVHKGFSLQEAEFQFNADVDPYLKANILFALAQNAGTSDYKLDPEEVFVETISLPVVTFKLGKFKTAIGKHNTLHTHAYPFIDAPLIHFNLLGDEGLNEPGVSGAVLLPAPWYSEITLQAVGTGNDTFFKSAKSKDVANVSHFKNLFDLSDDLTMELGLSGVVGRNQYDNNSRLWGNDLTFKWRPSVGGKYHALIWSTEYLNGNIKGASDANSGLDTSKLSGYASWVQYQFAERWWVQARGETSGLTHSPGLTRTNKQSALLGFFPSEFSGIRFQYDRLKAQGAATTNQVFTVQYNVSIGAHPAHNY